MPKIFLAYISLIFLLLTHPTGTAQKTSQKRIDQLVRFLISEDGGVSEYLSKRLGLTKGLPQFQVSTLKVKPSNRSFKINRDVFHIQLRPLNNQRLGLIRLKMSVPIGYQFKKKLPTLLVLGGAIEGSNTINYFTHPGQNILIGYDYAFSNQQFFHQMRRWEALNMDALDLALLYSASPRIRRRWQAHTFKKFDKTFGQVASLIHWIHQQKFVDSERVSFIAISFGSFIIPASFQLAEHLNKNEFIEDFFTSGVFIQGAGTILPFFQKNIDKIKEKNHRRAVRDIISTVSTLFNPTSYLPQLIGPKYLAISSRKDTVIPWESSQALYKSLRGPKKQIILNTPHVGRGKSKTLQEIEIRVKAWMLEHDFINP